MSKKKVDISKIKVQLYIKDAFLGCIATSVTIEADDSVGTACTDGTHIKYSTEFFSELSFDEQVGVIAHECGHIALMHMIRMKNLNDADAMIWNIAADYVVNHAIRGQFTLPDCALKCPYEFQSMNTEEIYKELIKNAQQIPNPMQDLEKPSESNSAQSGNGANGSISVEEQIKDIINKAQIASNNRSTGFSTNCMECARIINNLFRPKLNWRVLLRTYANNYKKASYSWARPNKRISDFYLPSLCGDELEVSSVNVYVDVSGSVSDDMVGRFLSELKRLFEDLNLTYMDIRGFSVGLDTLHHITDSNQLNKVSFKSNGGTDIEDVVEDLNKSNALFSIIFTDGYYCQSPIDSIKKKVFWIIYGNDDYVPGKGKVAHIDLSK